MPSAPGAISATICECANSGTVGWGMGRHSSQIERMVALGKAELELVAEVAAVEVPINHDSNRTKECDDCDSNGAMGIGGTAMAFGMEAVDASDSAWHGSDGWLSNRLQDYLEVLLISECCSPISA